MKLYTHIRCENNNSMYKNKTMCSVSVSSSTTRPKTSAVLVSGSMIRDSPSTANHYTRNKVVVAIKYSLVHYFTIRSSGYQEEWLYFLCCPTYYVPTHYVPVHELYSYSYRGICFPFLQQLERFTHMLPWTSLTTAGQHYLVHNDESLECWLSIRQYLTQWQVKIPQHLNG